MLCFREQHVITKKGIEDSKLVRLILQWAQAAGHVRPYTQGKTDGTKTQKYPPQMLMEIILDQVNSPRNLNVTAESKPDFSPSFG